VHEDALGGFDMKHANALIDDMRKTVADDKPRIIPLWSYECNLTKELSVTCMDWNKQNTDLLVAGYGNVAFGKKHNAGLVLFWSVKNERYPQKIIHTKHSVTCLAFSTEHAHVLAVGMYDGSVAIYDITEQGDKPALLSSFRTGKHSEPVWSLKWVHKDQQKQGTQLLMSISSDGTVKQWAIKKGLVPHPIMQLKRMANRAQFPEGTRLDGISREASGLCFDFPAHDGSEYYAGTEDGIIHKCSVSYNLQTLENYFGHTGAVYKVKCSPFLPEAFLSCSADWTCRLWNEKDATNSLVLVGVHGHDDVMDLVWSPSNSCVFGSVSRDGRVEVWDLDDSPLDPVVCLKTNEELSCVSFAPNRTPCILAGSASGTIHCYRVHGIPLDIDDWTIEQQCGRLADVMSSSKHDGGNSSSSAAAAAAAAAAAESKRNSLVAGASEAAAATEDKSESKQ
jgi:WD40 repeat protein